MATTAPLAKRPRTTGPLIGTHSGHFHADEALAVYMLRMLPLYSSSSLIRTRDPALLATCHTVVDVGGEYDDARKRYDHHQREFASTFAGRDTKLSSAGLVYKHYGREIVAGRTGLEKGGEEVETVWRKVYEDFVEAFDANDNGISAFDSTALGVKPRFNEGGFKLSSVVNRLNYVRAPAVEAASTAPSDQTNGAVTELTPEQLKEAEAERVKAVEDAQFLKASEFCGQQFESELEDVAENWLPARGFVRQAFAARKREDLDAQGRIMVLSKGAPWHDHLFAAEEDAGEVGSVLYVLFPEGDDAEGRTRIRAVSKAKEGFELRKPLPEAWRGVRDEQLDGVTGIKGCVFVHASGFIGGNKTHQGALAMAKRALELQ